MAVAPSKFGSGYIANTAIVLTPSSAAAQDEYIVLSVVQDIQTVTYTWPTGFTERGSVASSVDGQRLAFADKIAGASEPSSYTVTSTSSAMACWGIGIYSGVDTTTPRDVTATIQALGSMASPLDVIAPGVATGSANRYLVWIGASDFTSAGNATLTAPSASPATWTKRIEQNSNSSWANLGMCDCLDTAGTHTSDVTGVMTFGVTTGGRLAALIALRAATGGGGFIPAWARNSNIMIQNGCE